MLVLSFGMLGLIVGSFLNVLILRRGIRSLGGRSACPVCDKTLHWYDMFPVISWFVLGARCRMCRAPISIQYPLVEASTGILFALIGGAPFPVDILHKILSCAIAALLTAIFVYDLYHTIIPDPWVYAFDALALLAGAPLFLAGAPALLSLLSGPLAAAPLFILWAISRGAWMGFGDVKLALGIGWLLGPVWGIGAIFLAFIVGGIVSAPLLLFSSVWWRRMVQGFIPRHFWLRSGTGFTMKSEIPFGPFLIAACFLVWFTTLYGINLPTFLGVGLPG